MSSTASPRLQILAAALLFSTGGVAVKSCGLTPWQVASFRCGIAALAILALVPRARRRFGLREVLVGIAYAAMLTLYVLANKTTTAANAIFLQATAPLYILLLAPVLLGERSRWRDLSMMLGIAAGLAMLFVGQEPASATAPNPVLGNRLAAGAGLSWALTVMGLRWLGREGQGGGQAVVAVVVGNGLAFLVSLPMALPVEASEPSDWLWVIYLGVFQIGVAYFLLTTAAESVGAFEMSLLLLAEPVFNPVWTWWVHGEVPGPWALAGGVIVLSVTVIKIWFDSTGGQGSTIEADAR
ncbi:MAG: EamA family transporter [Acidobacteriota bacterium]